MEGGGISFELLKAGHCMHPECAVLRGGSRRAVEFPSLVGLLHHPVRGNILYDTGYSRHFMEATRGFPECLYRMITPPVLPPEEELLRQLEDRGLRAEDISTIVISHFHGDHVAGLRDFPQARFIATRSEYDEMSRKGRIARVRSAFLAALIPDDFESRAIFAETLGRVAVDLAGFPEAYDLLGDGSVAGIPLPGHTRSHLGLFFTDDSGRRLFLVGDACWKMEGIEQRRLPSRLASLLFADNAAYRETFFKLAALHEYDSDLTIIPSHCARTWDQEKARREGGGGDLA